MGRIAVMNPELANLIAAGEVIERPSSVVKELVENAIDANAKHIEISIFKAGREKIVVKDDGIGMDEIDAALAFKRHASSKIKSQYDLMSIKTLGFRGEALPSIAAVSKVELITSTGEKGTRVFLEPDKEMVIEDASARKGSIFTISELFYNTPARLKYLKADKTEISDIVEKVEHLALGFPAVSFVLYIDERQVIKTSGRGDLLECISALYGHDVAKKMVKIEAQSSKFSIFGYIAPPSISYATRYDMLSFINNRSVYIAKAQKAIIDSYKDYLAPTRYPLTIIYINVDSSLVDVNVHPSKKEVRLSSEEELASLITDTIKRALIRLRPTYSEVTSKDTVKIEVKAPVFNRPITPVTPINTSASVKSNYEVKNEEYGNTYIDNSYINIDSFKDEEYVQPLAQEQLTKEEPYQETLFENDESSQIPDLKPIGQILKTYIVCDGPDGLYLIDQHAAAERINYEKYEREFNQIQETVEPLFPIVIDLPYSSLVNFDVEHIALLKSLGIEASSFGGNSIRIDRIPITLKDDDDESVLTDIVLEALKDRKADISSLKHLAIASKACKASVRANAILSVESQNALIRELFKCQNPANCPHGRPTIIKISKADIEKLFKRTGF